MQLWINLIFVPDTDQVLDVAGSGRGRPGSPSARPHPFTHARPVRPSVRRSFDPSVRSSVRPGADLQRRIQIKLGLRVASEVSIGVRGGRDNIPRFARDVGRGEHGVLAAELSRESSPARGGGLGAGHEARTSRWAAASASRRTGGWPDGHVAGHGVFDCVITPLPSDVIACERVHHHQLLRQRRRPDGGRRAGGREGERTDGREWGMGREEEGTVADGRQGKGTK